MEVKLELWSCDCGSYWLSGSNVNFCASCGQPRHVRANDPAEKSGSPRGFGKYDGGGTRRAEPVQMPAAGDEILIRCEHSNPRVWHRAIVDEVMSLLSCPPQPGFVVRGHGLFLLSEYGQRWKWNDATIMLGEKLVWEGLEQLEALHFGWRK